MTSAQPRYSATSMKRPLGDGCGPSQGVGGASVHNDWASAIRRGEP